MKSSRRRRAHFLIGGLALALAPSAAAAPPPTFVFAGTVLAARAATLPGLPASERTIAVRVDGVLAAPPPLATARGRMVTVLRDGSAPPARRGERAVFFTAGWLLGDGAAVIEVAPAERGGREHAERRLAAWRRDWQESQLWRHLAAAEMVATGRVAAERPVAGAGRPAPLSEHDPEWHEALVEMREGLKGTAAAGTLVAVRFPSGRDVAFLRAPRIATGQEWIWMLAADRVTGAPAPAIQGHQAAAYVALDVLDVWPMAELGHVRALLARGGRRNP